MSLKCPFMSLQASPCSVACNIDAAPSVLTTSPLDSQTQSSPGYLPTSLTGLPHHLLLFFSLHEKDLP